MSSRVVVNGREVTNPVAKAAIGALAVLMAGATAAAVVFLVLPLVGIVVTFSVGIMGVILVALGVAIGVLILGGTLVGALLTPFAAFGDRKKPEELREQSDPGD